MKTASEILNLVDHNVDALEDGEALAALGITDEDQEAVEEAHYILTQRQVQAQYTMDNTEGYSASDLAELNRRYETAAAGVTDPDELQRISERVLADFDTEQP